MLKAPPVAAKGAFRAGQTVQKPESLAGAGLGTQEDRPAVSQPRTGVSSVEQPLARRPVLVEPRDRFGTGQTEFGDHHLCDFGQQLHHVVVTGRKELTHHGPLSLQPFVQHLRCPPPKNVVWSSVSLGGCRVSRWWCAAEQVIGDCGDHLPSGLYGCWHSLEVELDLPASRSS